MAKTIFKKVSVKGISACAPQGEIDIYNELEYYKNDKTKVDRLNSLFGFHKRRVCDEKTTASDLSFCAAQKLLSDMNIDRSTIDALVFVTTLPDVIAPATACILHGRLGLSSHCTAFDINQGCAGYVYGLWVASSLIEGGGCKRVLLLVGDNWSRKVNIKDRITAPVFGDGGSATLVEYEENAAPSYYVVGADGRGADAIILPAGGMRMPCSEETKKETTDAKGNTRTLENIHMNGAKVFEFTMEVVPANIKETLLLAGKTPDEIDFLVLHQANKQIVENVAFDAGFMDLNKVPYKTIEKYANQTVASIPCAIADQLCDKISSGNNLIMLSGFGIGLAWGSAILQTSKIYCSGIIDYTGEKK